MAVNLDGCFQFGQMSHTYITKKIHNGLWSSVSAAGFASPINHAIQTSAHNGASSP